MSYLISPKPPEEPQHQCPWGCHIPCGQHRKMGVCHGPKPKTERRQRPWSPEEDATLRELAARGLSQTRIAAEMGRTIGATAGAIRRLGLTTTGGVGGHPRKAST